MLVPRPGMKRRPDWGYSLGHTIEGGTKKLSDPDPDTILMQFLKTKLNAGGKKSMINKIPKF